MEATRGRERELDEQAADHIGRHFEWRGRQFRAGDFVALLGGEVVAAARTFDEAERAFLRVEPARRRGLICRVETPVPDVIRGPR
ncbi:MAG TPA: hypothetical protein VFX49_22915 [Chloroflexota bacterium]|nr:hypothetical protein [Chloroflexota bacterium]